MRAILAALTMAICATAAGADLPAGRVTFSRDIAPILQKNCQTCHRPGEAAPMSLLTYEDARPWAKSIREKVASRVMPPWHADPAVGTWKNNRSLSDEQIETVVTWVDQGAAEGDPKDLPSPTVWTEGWTIGEPDMVFTILQEQVLEPDLVDQYRYLFIPMGLKEDKWIDAIEVRPGNRSVVHHVNVFETSKLNSPEAVAERAAAAERAKTTGEKARNMSGEGFGVFGEPPGRVGGFLPGGATQILNEGEGVLLPAGASLILQIHYHKETGLEVRDRTTVGVRFCKEPVRKRLWGGAVNKCKFKIPAGADNHEVVAELSVRDAIRITAMSPHMHLRGKNFEVWAELPGGEKLDILRVPKYDFNWQTTYEPAAPISIPAGSKLCTRAFYDNSKANPFNPNPSIDVEWGEPTTDEMMLMFFRYTLESDEIGG